MRIRLSLPLLAALLIGSSLQLAHAQLTINTTTATDWKISNGAISLDWDSTGGRVFSMYLTAVPSDNLVDTTSGNEGLYMDNVGTDFNGITSAPTGVTPTAGYNLVAGQYLDWWISWHATGGNVFTITEHFIVAPNDSTLWTYYVTDHSSSATSGSFGQIQYVYRISLTDFPNTYEVNSGLNNLGATVVTRPTETSTEIAETGRDVQNAVFDLHGITLPSEWGREFDTKYDFCSYEYLSHVNGAYGSQFGAWSIFPTMESGIGGPSKQIETYTGNILMGELYSNHLDNDISYVTTGNTTRIWGPVGFHFNAFGGSISTAAEMYADAETEVSKGLSLFAIDSNLTGSGYIPDGSKRGTVSPTISGGGSGSSNTAWAVLSDQNKNMEYSSIGYQFWTSLNSSGQGTISNVVPGTYRLSTYVLGEWGQLREDGVTVTAGGTTSPSLTFTPENFSPSGDAAIWTIGTPDRSAHEFLHGENNYGSTGSCSGCDDREFYGNWNYWADFASTNGSVKYYATAVGSTPATNNLQKWNYTQWNSFDPGLYDASNDTTDNYINTIPTYVKSLSGETGTNGVTTPTPPWYVYFTTTSAQSAQGPYVDLSVGLACNEADLTVSLNGHALTWNSINVSDCSVRSGLSGYYQWVVFEWPTSDLVAAGSQDTLTFTVTANQEGITYDALRMEIANRTANPSTTGWHDYEYVTSGTYVAADDAVANNDSGGGGGCTPTAITPYISINGGSTWTEESSATATSTSVAVDLGPQPVSGGSWSWTGPNGYTSTSRQIDSIPLTVGTDSYVATYTNTSGCKSSETFTITVN